MPTEHLLVQGLVKDLLNVPDVPKRIRILRFSIPCVSSIVLIC